MEIYWIILIVFREIFSWFSIVTSIVALCGFGLSAY